MQTLSVPHSVRPKPLAPKQRSRGCLTKLRLREENLRFCLLGVGLTFYLLIGAVVFHFVEAENEIAEKKNYNETVEMFLNNYTVPRDALMNLLHLHGNLSSYGYMYGRPRWDYPGALYFTGTLISTIGFGMAAPQTTLGRGFVIIYGFFGCASTILFFNLFLERAITFISFLLRKIQRCAHTRSKRVPQHKAACQAPSIEISDASDISSPGPVLRQRTPYMPWKPSVLGVQSCLLCISLCWILIAATTFAFVEKWNPFIAVYYCFVSFSTVGFGDYVASQFNEQTRPDAGRLIHLYRFCNFCFLTVGCCLVYSLFNVTSIIIRKYLDWIIRRMDVKVKKEDTACYNLLCGRRRSRPYGLGLSDKAQAYRRRLSSDDGLSRRSSTASKSRRSSTASKVSLLEFLAQNQTSVFMMHKQLVMTKSVDNGPKPKVYLSTPEAITENAVGPLQIMSQKFGDD